MATLHFEITGAMQRMGWVIIDVKGCELSSSPRICLSGPPIGATRLFCPKSGYVVDVQGYTAVFWHALHGTPGRGRNETLESLAQVLQGGDEHFEKYLGKIAG